MPATKRQTQAQGGRWGSGGRLFRTILGAISALTYYTLAIRPWLLGWGATAEEIEYSFARRRPGARSRVYDHPSGNGSGFSGIDLALACSAGPGARGVLHLRSA
jgi:hypothetical protein